MNKLIIFSLLRNFIIVLLYFVSLEVYSQSITLTAGTDVSDSLGSMSYSIGQTIYEATETENGDCYGGIQQPIELIFVSNEVFVIEHYSGQMLICDNHEGEFCHFFWYKDGLEVGTDNNYYFESTGLDGVYYLKATDISGKVYISKSFSCVKSEVSNKSLSIYPLPAIIGKDTHILLSDETEHAESKTTTLLIFESSGEIVHSQEMEINVPLTVNMSFFPPGVYIVKVGDLSSKMIVR